MPTTGAFEILAFGMGGVSNWKVILLHCSKSCQPSMSFDKYKYKIEIQVFLLHFSTSCQPSMSFDLMICSKRVQPACLKRIDC